MKRSHLRAAGWIALSEQFVARHFSYRVYGETLNQQLIDLRALGL